MRPKEVEDCKFEKSKKTVQLKKKVKMKKPKHNSFKVWGRPRWKGTNVHISVVYVFEPF